MANFPRQKPTGFAMFEILASAIATAWDVCISKAVNGDDGSAHDGDVTLGSLTTNRDVHSTQDVVSDRDVLVDRDVVALRDVNVTRYLRVPQENILIDPPALASRMARVAFSALGEGATYPFQAVVDSTWRMPLELPHASVLEAVTAWIKPANHADLPEFMPTLSIWRNDVSGVPVQIGSTSTDDSVDSSAYSAAHTIACTSLAETVDCATYSYFAEFRQEHGTDSIDGVIRALIPAVTLSFNGAW